MHEAKVLDRIFKPSACPLDADLKGNEFPTLSIQIVRWGETPAILEPEDLERISARYHEWVLDKPAIGDLSHAMYTESLFPHDAFEVLEAFHRQPIESQEIGVMQTAGSALRVIDYALSQIDEYSEARRAGHDGSSFNSHAAFYDMMAKIEDGEPCAQTLAAGLKLARRLTRDAIYMSKDMEFLETAVSARRDGVSLNQIREDVMRQFEEAKTGLRIPDHLKKRLEEGADLVFSIDVNSVINVDESHPSPKNISQVAARIRALEVLFHDKFPDRKILFVINTGRPSPYAWGVIEMTGGTEAMRKLIIAEEGGAVSKGAIELGQYEAAVDNPIQWKIELDLMKKYFVDLFSGSSAERVAFEDKLSQLSFQIAPRDSDGNDWLYQLSDGTSLSAEWVAKEMKKYLTKRIKTLNGRWKAIQSVVETTPGIEQELRDRLNGNGNGHSDSASTMAEVTPNMTKAELRDATLKIIKEWKHERQDELEEVNASLKTLEEMDDNLEARFNTTAGYVDIKDGRINKFSSLRKELKKRGIDVSKAVIIHIGDSGTDIMPIEDDNHPENKGADSVLLVAVADSSDKLLKAVKDRGDEYGIVTARRSTLGLSDTVHGLERMIIGLQ